MKKNIMNNRIPFFLFFTLLFYNISAAQTPLNKVNNEDCDCVEVPVDFSRLCSYSKDKKRSTLDEFTFLFEETILKMSCVDLKKDSRETIIRKVNCMWNKYKTKCACDSLGFNVPGGNLLKFVINFDFDDWYYLMVETYNLDILFVDPADGKTLTQYLDEEIAKTNKYGPDRLKEMKEIGDDIFIPKKYNPITQLFEMIKK